MVYFLLGEDRLAKDQRIAELKEKFLAGSLPPQDTLPFDQEILYTTALDPQDLKKSLLALPAVASKRFVVIRGAFQKLHAHNKKILLEFVQGGHDHLILILDASEANDTDGFIREMSPYANVMRSHQRVKQNVFDMTNAMAAGHGTQALKILNDLFADGNHPLQIMGGLVWFWGKRRDRLPAEKFHEGLRNLQEADLNIKRSRLRPECALEVLVAKLTALIKPI
jgi:DNA polymerase III delta subunit